MNIKIRVIQNVFIRNPSSQTRASYVQLVRDYKKLDRDYNWRMNIGFRISFLKEFYTKHGGLFCEYCGKRELLLKATKKEELTRLATLDHVIPLSKGGRRFDHKNIKVCCPICNGNKRDKDIKEFLEELH